MLSQAAVNYSTARVSYEAVFGNLYSGFEIFRRAGFADSDAGDDLRGSLTFLRRPRITATAPVSRAIADIPDEATISGTTGICSPRSKLITGSSLLSGTNQCLFPKWTKPIDFDAAQL
jgi:hypothetical protein